MASVHNRFSFPAAVLENYQPSKDDIGQAKADLFDFLISEHAERILGSPLSALKDHFVRARSEYRIPAQRFDGVMGELFADLIDQATAAGVLDESVSKVFYSHIDRAAFVESVATDIIAYVVVHERMPPVIMELEPALVLAAYNELVQYISTDLLTQFKSQVWGITEESSGNFDLAYCHQDPELPSYSSYLASIIQGGVRRGLLSSNVSEIFFSKALDRKEFVRNLIAEIMRS